MILIVISLSQLFFFIYFTKHHEKTSIFLKKTYQNLKYYIQQKAALVILDKINLKGHCWHISHNLGGLDIVFVLIKSEQIK